MGDFPMFVGFLLDITFTMTLLKVNILVGIKTKLLLQVNPNLTAGGEALPKIVNPIKKRKKFLSHHRLVSGRAQFHQITLT